MKFFTTAIMNGATLFGVSITLFALTFALSDKLSVYKQIPFFSVAFLYLIASILAFLFPSLSE